MTDLYDAAEIGNLERVIFLLEQGGDKNQVSGSFNDSALGEAAGKGHFDIVRYLVEQGADTEKAARDGHIPLIDASRMGHTDVVRYLLEQGVNRDKADDGGWTSLHYAAAHGRLEVAKLLMVYGADLNARNNDSQLPIECALTEEIKQSIRDEQDRHPNAATSAPVQQEEENGEEADAHINKKPRLDEGVAEEGKIAEADENSERG